MASRNVSLEIASSHLVSTAGFLVGGLAGKRILEYGSYDQRGVGGKGGRLILRVNDQKGSFGDNSGAWTVRIHVHRPQFPV